MKIKNTRGETFWVVMMIVAGIVLSVLALGLIMGENKYVGLFTGEYKPSESADEEACGLLVDEPIANEVFEFPFTVSGKINGCGWVAFEGEVGTVSIIDGYGEIVSTEPLTATSPWMTEIVTFDQNLNVPFLDTTFGKLRFRNQDPSGENPLYFDIPVDFE